MNVEKGLRAATIVRLTKPAKHESFKMREIKLPISIFFSMKSTFINQTQKHHRLNSVPYLSNMITTSNMVFFIQNNTPLNLLQKSNKVERKLTH